MIRGGDFGRGEMSQGLMSQDCRAEMDNQQNQPTVAL